MAVIVGLAVGTVRSEDRVPLPPPRKIGPALGNRVPSRQSEAAELAGWQKPDVTYESLVVRVPTFLRTLPNPVVKTAPSWDALPIAAAATDPSTETAANDSDVPVARPIPDELESRKQVATADAWYAEGDEEVIQPVALEQPAEGIPVRSESRPASVPTQKPAPNLFPKVAQKPAVSDSSNVPQAPLPNPFPVLPGAVPPAPAEPIPGSRQQVRIPLAGPPNAHQIELTPDLGGRISLVVRDAPLNEVLAALALQQGINIVSAEDVTVRISVTLRDVSFEDAMTALTSVGGFTWNSQNNIIQVTNLAGAGKVAPIAQGQIVQVINLNFVSGTDVESVAKGLLSPVGQIFTTLSSQTDNRKTHDVVVIQDLPQYVARVTEYIAQVDHPPRQVLIEAHVLEVNLTDDTRHGVNWETLARVDNSRLTWKALPFAAGNPLTMPLFTVDGHDLDVVVEAIKATTDSKTLAQPRLLVLNGQQARLQIGKKSGYLVTTTTQTSTLQNVEFLNTGVLLTVRPQISNDNHVMLSVKPEVSDGGISAQTNLPETTTTEVETNVMLANGQGIVIGGLIRETDSDRQTKIPYLGDLWLVGRAFQKRQLLRERKEIVVALVPRIVPYSPDFVARDKTNFQRATTPLLEGSLKPVYRPWEPKLPDAMLNPRRWRLDRVPNFFRNLKDPYPLPPEHYFPAPTDEVPWVDVITGDPNEPPPPLPGWPSMFPPSLTEPLVPPPPSPQFSPPLPNGAGRVEQAPPPAPIPAGPEFGNPPPDGRSSASPPVSRPLFSKKVIQTSEKRRGK